MASADVNTPSLAYQLMSQHWELPRTLMGGTMAMRAAGRTYLPKEDRETPRSYRARLARSVLFPGLKQTVHALSGKPFQKPVSVNQEAPEEIRKMIDDVDRAGRNLTIFSKDLFQDAVLDGYSAILVDYPSLETTPSLAQERQQEIGPYFVDICAANLIEVKTEGQGPLARIVRARIRESVIEEDGDYGEKRVQRVRVLYPDRVQVYRLLDDTKSGKDDWILEAQYKNTLGKVPLVPIYTGRVGNWVAMPPLEDLAYLNLKHWQSQSDQDNILHFARVPLLFFAGATSLGGDITIGADNLIKSENPQARLTFVEHTGEAINAGRTDLVDLERQMAVLGYEPLVMRADPGNMTATQRAIDAAESETKLVSWARGLEDALNAALSLAAEWRGIKDPKIKASVNTEWSLSLREQTDLQALIDARKLGDLSRKSFLGEYKRRSVLPESFDVDQEEEEINREGVSLADLQPPPPELEGGAA